MYISPPDSVILRSDEVSELQKQYAEKFGERFMRFNYADFREPQDLPFAQNYLNELKKAVLADTPYRIVSNAGVFTGE